MNEDDRTFDNGWVVANLKEYFAIPDEEWREHEHDISDYINKLFSGLIIESRAVVIDELSKLFENFNDEIYECMQRIRFALRDKSESEFTAAVEDLEILLEQLVVYKDDE